MSISLVNGPKPSGAPTKPSKTTDKPAGSPGKSAVPGKKEEDKPTNPQIKSLEKQKEMIEKRIERLHGRKASLASCIRKMAITIEPKSYEKVDPNYATKQIQKLLTKLGISAKIQRNKTQVTTMTNSGGLKLYEVHMRQGEGLSDTEISKLNDDSVEGAIPGKNETQLLYLWYEYKPEGSEITE